MCSRKKTVQRENSVAGSGPGWSGADWEGQTGIGGPGRNGGLGLAQPGGAGGRACLSIKTCVVGRGYNAALELFAEEKYWYFRQIFFREVQYFPLIYWFLPEEKLWKN